MASEQTASVQAAAFEAQLQDLRRQLQELSRRVDAIEHGAARAVPEPLAGEPLHADVEVTGTSWLLQSALLRRMATISFVLVFALVLRTLVGIQAACAARAR